jgi:hypothetical protein
MSGWAIGFTIGIVVVVVVVVLLLLMIVGARNVAAKAEATLEALVEARDNTAALWAVSDTNAAAKRIVEAATQAREALSGGGSEQ